MAISSNIQFSSFLLKGNEEDVLSYNFENLVTWIKSLPKPTGVLCCNDDFGQILINACSMAQVKVPHEIAVLGIDNDELTCNITYPNLSSIARNHQSAAFNICSTLSDMLQGKVPNQQIILTEALEVIERTSTDAVAIADKEVNKSIQFISANIHKNLEVQNVVQASNSSLKVLNQKFEKAIGHSIFQEIQLRKLSDSNNYFHKSSIKEIAFELGFNDHSHISRWFSKLEGITPMEWRKKMEDKNLT
jgi:LacI family transcriptional regulator